MEITVTDVSTLLMMSEKEVINLVKKNEIPSQTIHEKPVFNKHQIVEWALLRNIPLNLSHEKMKEYQIKELSSLLDQSSFFYNCDFSKENYIEQMVNMLDLDKNIDKDIIVQLLKSREEWMSTAIGQGISLPHPRIPIMIGRDNPVIAFFFLKNPLDLNAIDDKPVHTIILLISQTIKQHLSLLAHLNFLLLNEQLRTAVKNRSSYTEILDQISTIEKNRHA
ncbi:MAG: PTS sugar transporter subunit IIA [Spirochaetota bacterium]